MDPHHQTLNPEPNMKAPRVQLAVPLQSTGCFIHAPCLLPLSRDPKIPNHRTWSWVGFAPGVCTNSSEARQPLLPSALNPVSNQAQALQKSAGLQVRLDAAKAKAEGVAAQPDISGVSKAREINKIMARARSGKGGKAAKPSRSAARKQQSKGPRLDRRMMSDKRQVMAFRFRVWTLQPVSCGRACCAWSASGVSITRYGRRLK